MPGRRACEFGKHGIGRVHFGIPDRRGRIASFDLRGHRPPPHGKLPHSPEGTPSLVRIDLNLVVTLEVVEHHGAAPAQDKYSDDDITEHAEIVVGGADRTRDAAAVAETKLIGLTAPRVSNLTARRFRVSSLLHCFMCRIRWKSGAVAPL